MRDEFNILQFSSTCFNYFHPVCVFVCVCVCVCVCVGWCVCVCVHPQRVNGVRLPVKADNKTTALAIIEFRVC